MKAAQAAVRDRVTLPQGYRLDWTGQYQFQVRARERLQLLVPVVFACILLLLYLTFHSLSEATIVMLSVVYAMTGGVIHSGCSATTSPSPCGWATSRSTESPCKPAW